MMLQLRKEQEELLAEISRENFINKMSVHIEKFFPEFFKEQGDDLEEFIESGLEKANKFKIKSEKSTCKFIDLLIVLGSDFDEKPKTKWAMDVFNDPDIFLASEKVDKVFKLTIEKKAAK